MTIEERFNLQRGNENTLKPSSNNVIDNYILHNKKIRNKAREKRENEIAENEIMQQVEKEIIKQLDKII